VEHEILLSSDSDDLDDGQFDEELCSLHESSVNDDW
jgi:hypothetical protein